MQPVRLLDAPFLECGFARLRGFNCQRRLPPRTLFRIPQKLPEGIYRFFVDGTAVGLALAVTMDQPGILQFLEVVGYRGTGKTHAIAHRGEGLLEGAGNFATGLIREHDATARR